MTLFDSIFSGVFSAFGNIMSLFGYTLAHPIQFLIRLVCLYLAIINLASFLLRAINFSYWRLFEHLKYIIMLGALIAHLSCTLGDLGNGIIVKVIATISAIIVMSYLVQFAWVIGKMYVDSKAQMRNSILQGLLLGQFALIGILWFFLLRQHNLHYGYYLYLFAVLMLMFFKSNVSIVTSCIIICFMMIQKYIALNTSTNLALILQGLLLYIALDREGKELGVQNIKDEYPPKTYLFFACLQLYIYFLFDSQTILMHQGLLGVVYAITVMIS